VALQQSCAFAGQPCTKAVPYTGTYLPLGVASTPQTLTLSPSFLLSWLNDTSGSPSLAERRASRKRLVIFSPNEQDEVRWTLSNPSVAQAATWTRTTLDTFLGSRTSGDNVLAPIFVSGDSDLKGSLRLTLDSTTLVAGQDLQIPLVETTGEVYGDWDAIRVVLRDPLLSSRNVARVTPTLGAVSSVVVVRVRLVPATIVLDDANPVINATDLLDADRAVTLQLDPASDTPIEFAGDADLSNSSLSIDLGGGGGDGGDGPGGDGEGEGEGEGEGGTTPSSPPPRSPTKTKTIEISGDANLAGARLRLAVPPGTEVGTVVLELRVAGNLTSTFDHVSLEPASAIPDPGQPCRRFTLEQRVESPSVVHFVYVAEPVSAIECLYNSTLCTCLLYDPLSTSGTGSLASSPFRLALGLAVATLLFVGR
jgi:hypothetical protein